ncbi:hypothetical protein HPB50_007804 [Hyalomma asiaticum]|uniref:Uncharacterized protein n=1 Tax=Hyalomma asiaticum TaxID=266040 RepID=A0ACB7STP0_HYAAI|nr:hypothetical protein HPB50_007804 [Hyalomma asiaticum]
MDDSLKLLNEVVESTRSQQRELSAANRALKTENEDLQRKVADLEQYSRLNNLEIKGVPSTQGEDCSAILTAIGDKINWTYEEARDETSRKRLPVPPADASSSSSDDGSTDTPKKPVRENLASRLKHKQRSQLESSSSTEDECMMSTSEAAKLRKENPELKK